METYTKEHVKKSLDMYVEEMYSGLHADFAEAACTGRPADWV